MAEKADEARAPPLNPLTDAELQMIEARQAVGLSVTDTLAKALGEVREARAWRKRMRAAMLDCARDIEKEYPAWARDWREMAGNADASPPPDSSAALREARRLLGEIAEPKPCVDMADPVENQLHDALHEIGLIRMQARTFLGEQNGKR